MKHFAGLLSVVTGIMLILEYKGYHYLDWFYELPWSVYYVPGLMIVAGLLLLSHRGHAERHYGHMKGDDIANVMDENAHIDVNVLFSGSKYNLSGERFTGAEINALFGGVELDLRNAVLAPECNLQIKTMMGGVVIYVPRDVRMEIACKNIMGGVEDKTSNAPVQTAKLLRFNVECMMGGVEIRN